MQNKSKKFHNDRETINRSQRDSKIISRSENEPIAIVGIGCRFPGGIESPQQFWDLLVNGVDAVSEVPVDRWSIDKYFDSNPDVSGKARTRWGGFVKDIEYFDPAFFGISPREAKHMDPQQRMLLETTWWALEDSGMIPAELNGTDTAVFIGIASSDYWDVQLSESNNDLIDAYTNLGGSMSIVANRISYIFGFQGPSISVDTACSSSLVAVHLACNSIWNGESTLAIAGGVNALIKPEVTVGFSKANMLSPDGRCKAFDASANGYVRGEGAGVIVLKPLSEAVNDNDRIYAVIPGSAVNQDGRSDGITVPTERAQNKLLFDAYKRAGISPGDVSYVEAHGTGTPVGDPIEANAIGSVVRTDRKDGSSCILGAVKTNIGHLESASGIAGLIKVALSFLHETIPPNLHFNEGNPDIDFKMLCLEVPTDAVDWPKGKLPRIAGVNSFGFGGTNAHVVLADPPTDSAKIKTTHVEEGCVSLVPFSAESDESLNVFIKEIRKTISTQDGLPEIVNRLGLRRGHYSNRLAIVAESVADLTKNIDGYMQGEESPFVQSGQSISDSHNSIVFVFTGMGPQWWAMGRQLIKTQPVYREMIEKCEQIFQEYAGWSLLDELQIEDEANSRMNETQVAQPANFILQVALAELWRTWGIIPNVIVGHSTGEVAAAYCAGALSLEDAIQVIYHRSRLQQSLAGSGSMVAVGLPVSQIEQLIRNYNDQVSIAAVNGPNSVTLAGDTICLDEIVKPLQAQETFCRYLQVEIPFHSPVMNALEHDLKESLSTIRPQPATVPIYSSVTGGEIYGESFDAEYWWKNVRQPVLFCDVIQSIVRSDQHLFLELGPHPVLATSIADSAAGINHDVEVLSSLRRHENDDLMLATTLAKLYTKGFQVNWKNQTPNNFLSFKGYPLYFWERSRFWGESNTSKNERLSKIDHPLLGSRINDINPKWNARLDLNRISYLSDHIVQTSAVFPAAAYIEMVFAASRALSPNELPIIENMQLKKALYIQPDKHYEIQLSKDVAGRFQIASKEIDGEKWNEYALGELHSSIYGQTSKQLSLKEFEAQCGDELSIGSMYERFHKIGLNYGTCFQGITKIKVGAGKSLARIELPEQLLDQSSQYILHPSVLDAGFQALFVNLKSFSETGPTNLYLPVFVKHLRLYRKPEDKMWACVHLLNQNENIVESNIMLYTDNGDPVAEIRGFRLQTVPNTKFSHNDQIKNWLYEYKWLPKTLNTGIKVLSGVPYPVEKTKKEMRAHAVDLRRLLDRHKYYESVEPLFNTLAVSYFVSALNELGFSWNSSDTFTIEDAYYKLEIDKQHTRLLENVLQLLTKEGYVCQVNDSTWQTKHIPIFDPCQEQLHQLRQQFPDYHPELDLIGRCGVNLAAILTGKLDSLQVLFPGGDKDSPRRFYQQAPSFHIYNELVLKFLQMLPAKTEDNRNIRILEIGGGTGGMTASVLPHLQGKEVEYVFTDISPAFIASAEEQFSMYSFVDYQVLDIEQDSWQQGFKEHTFDLVLASDVLHATRDIKETLLNVSKVLAENGSLVLLETTKSTPWVDLVFGITEGWWRFEDTDLRPTHPTLTPDNWITLLNENQFKDSFCLVDSDRQEKSLQSVIIAKRSEENNNEISAEKSILKNNKAVWTIFKDSQGYADELIDQLRSEKQKVISIDVGDQYQRLDSSRYIINPSDPEQYQQLIIDVSQDEDLDHRFVHLWSAYCTNTEQTNQAQLQADQLISTYSVLYLIQALEASPWIFNPKCWLVTSGAVHIESHQGESSISSATLWGLGRVAMTEYPNIDSRLIDIGRNDSNYGKQDLFNEIWTSTNKNIDTTETEIAIKNGKRYVHRLTRVRADELKHRDKKTVSAIATMSYGLECHTKGDLNSFQFVEKPRISPTNGEIEIEVHAAGLNFKDVMLALGKLPYEAVQGTYCGYKLGMEVSGRVVSVGKNVEEFSIGDAVIAIAPEGLSSYVTTNAQLAVLKPDCLDWQQGAAIPIAFGTAYYCLNDIARLKSKERILIHAATGGVGLSAVQIALEKGAEIYATAGSEKKREYLRNLGVHHVMDSRSLSFADEILDHTNGEGVDVVLNSLSGAAIGRSLAVLSPYGRFVEIGKTDIYQNSTLGLLPFRNNLSYTAVDLDKIMKERPKIVRKILRNVAKMIQEKNVPPLPCNNFLLSDVSDAFRFMAQAKQIGKVVLSYEKSSVDVIAGSRDGLTIVENATYLITGGLGGFGLAIAEWLVSKGSKYLALMGRSGNLSDNAQNIINKLKALGATVSVYAADVSKKDDVQAVMKSIEKTGAPLKGIFHAAMVLDDGALSKLNIERMEKVVSPKVYGAWNLHEQSINAELDYFLMFSSVTALFGNAGQGNYVAANAYLGALASYRKTIGLPAITVDWGALGEVGFVSRNESVSDHLEQQGLHGFTTEEVLYLLEIVLTHKPVQVGAMRMDWAQWATMNPGLAATNRFKRLFLNKSEGKVLSEFEQSGHKHSAIAQLILAAENDKKRHDILVDGLRNQAALTLNTTSINISPDKALVDQGLDSLMAVELQTWTQQELGVEAPTMDLMQGLSINKLSERLVSQITEGSSDNVKVQYNDKREPNHVSVEFMSWVDNLQNEMLEAFNSWGNKQVIENDVGTNIGLDNDNVKKLSARLLQASLELGELVNDLSYEQHIDYRNYYREKLLDLLLHSSFIKRAYDKPLGYAGDYEMMNMIYRRKPNGETYFDIAVDDYALNEPGAIAVVNRIDYMGKHLSRDINKVEGRRARMANIGCGPARELIALLENQPELGAKLDIVFIDQDERPLNYIKTKLEPIVEKTGVKIRFICKSIDKLFLEDEFIEMLGNRDVIYSVGLFDYFNEQKSQEFLALIYRNLIKGGRLYIGNIADDNPSQWMMEYITDWFIFHKNREQLQSFGKKLKPEASFVSVEGEPLGVNLFLVVEK